MDLSNLSSNWKKLQATLGAPSREQPAKVTSDLKRKRSTVESSSQHARIGPTARKKQRKDVDLKRSAIKSPNVFGKQRNTMGCEKKPSNSKASPILVNAGLSTKFDTFTTQ